jgi:hypothetical protein
MESPPVDSIDRVVDVKEIPCVFCEFLTNF